MKIKILTLFLVITLGCEGPSYAAFDFLKKKSESAAAVSATKTVDEKVPVAKTAAGAAKQSEQVQPAEELTKEEKEQIFEEQKDLKNLKDSDRLAKQGVQQAVLSRSTASQPNTNPAVRLAAGGGGRGGTLVVPRPPVRPVQRPVIITRPVSASVVRPVVNPNTAVTRAPERPAQNPNSSIARAPERPAGR